jgi:hypothetical protein
MADSKAACRAYGEGSPSTRVHLKPHSIDFQMGFADYTSVNVTISGVQYVPSDKDVPNAQRRKFLPALVPYPCPLKM